MLLYSALVSLASIENVILVAKAGVVMQHPRAAGVFAIMLFSVHEARWYTTMCMLYFCRNGYILLANAQGIDFEERSLGDRE